MEQTDRNHKKKYNPSELPSCFMTPESPQDHQFGRSTPCFDASPLSCFLTPPSSQEKVLGPHSHLLSLQGLPKLNFELEDGNREESNQQSHQERSPLLPEDRIVGRLIGKQSVDLICDLLALNCSMICDEICSYLESQDLCRFASVCSKWRNFMKQNSQERERWKGFLEQCKEHYILKGKENHGIWHSLKSSSCYDLARLPLQNINLNIPTEKSHGELNKGTKTPELSDTYTQIQRHSVTRQAGNELRACPKCTSPSNFSKTQEGHCQCQKCGLMFCSMCLRDTEQHASGKQCNGLSTAPSRTDQRQRPRKSGKDDIVCSKRTKNRLRRL